MFVVAMITPVAITTIGYRYYIVYAIVAGTIPPLVYFFYPETMNRNLEQLDLIFKEAPTVWSIVSMANSIPKGDTAIASSEKREAFTEQIERHEEQAEYERLQLSAGNERRVYG
jgi:hypothetical protein